MLTGKTWRGEELWLPRHDTDPPRAIGQVMASVSRSLCDTGLLYEKTRLQLVCLAPGGRGVEHFQEDSGKTGLCRELGARGGFSIYMKGWTFANFSTFLFPFFPSFFLTPPCPFARDIFVFARLSVCGVGIYTHLPLCAHVEGRG